MEGRENKTKNLEIVLSEKDEKERCIRFDDINGTLLVKIDKNILDFSDLKTEAEKRGLLEKDEFHITIIGSATGKEIMTALEVVPSDEKNRILNKIKELAMNINWKFFLRPEFYYIKKEYNRLDDANPDKTIVETRQSIIQLIDTKNLKEFYTKLQKIAGLTFATPFSHITLFTVSTEEDNKKRGIGIYSEEDFETLNAEKVTL